ncbi:MAG TPA: hypothetical protein VF808_14380 [Ktedonobacterales bacterium]
MEDNSPASVLPTATAAAAPAPRLRRRWLALARIGWVAVTLCAVTFYVVTLPSYVAYLRVVIPSAACNGCLQLSPADVQTLRHLGLSIDAYVWYVIATKLLILLGYCAVGAVLVWRASTDRVALLASLTLILYTVLLYAPPDGGVPGWPLLPEEALAFLGAVCLGLFLCIFPSGRFVPRWTPWLLLAWTAYRAYDIFALSFPNAPLVRTPPDFAISVCLTAGLVAAQVYRYRRVSTPAQRQQTKWVVLGVALGAGGYLAAFLVFVVMGTVFSLSQLVDHVGFAAGNLLSLLIPLGLGVAVLRYHLFDIDVIIRRTLVYGSLTVILAAIYLAVVFGLQSLVTALTRQTSPQPVIIVASTLLSAMLITPLRRQIQAAVDRRFYRAKYDAARTVEAFAATLRTETDLRALSEQLMVVVQATMQPATVSLWLRESGRARMDQPTGGSDGRWAR